MRSSSGIRLSACLLILDARADPDIGKRPGRAHVSVTFQRESAVSAVPLRVRQAERSDAHAAASVASASGSATSQNHRRARWSLRQNLERVLRTGSHHAEDRSDLFVGGSS